MEDEKKEVQGVDIDALASVITAKIAMPENITGQVNEAIEKAFKDRGYDEIRRKAGLFNAGDLPEEVTKEAMKRAFWMGVLKSGIPGAQLTPLQTKALSGTTTAGGYLVADEHKSDLIMRAAELSDLYRYVRVWPVITDAGDFPTLNADVSITWGRTQNDAITETDPTFDQFTFAITNMSALTYLSREVVDDSNPAIADVVTQLFSEAISAERDKKVAIGTNSSQPEGIMSASGVSAITGTSGELTYRKLVALKYGLKRKYQQPARFLMNSTTLSWCHQIQDTTGQPIIKDALVSNEQPRILGKPYSVQDDIGDGYIAYGDMRKYYWFDRQKMAIESTTTGGDTFSKHQLAVKVVERCDGGVALGEAFKKSGAFTVPTS